MDPTRLTLRQWYEQRFAALYHADASPRTHAEYSATLNVWAALTADPPLAEITTFTLAAFRQAAKDLGYAAATPMRRTGKVLGE